MFIIFSITVLSYTKDIWRMFKVHATDTFLDRAGPAVVNENGKTPSFPSTALLLVSICLYSLGRWCWRYILKEIRHLVGSICAWRVKAVGLWGKNTAPHCSWSWMGEWATKTVDVLNALFNLMSKVNTTRDKEHKKKDMDYRSPGTSWGTTKSRITHTLSLAAVWLSSRSSLSPLRALLLLATELANTVDNMALCLITGGNGASSALYWDYKEPQIIVGNDSPNRTA